MPYFFKIFLHLSDLIFIWIKGEKLSVMSAQRQNFANKEEESFTPSHKDLDSIWCTPQILLDNHDVGCSGLQFILCFRICDGNWTNNIHLYVNIYNHICAACQSIIITIDQLVDPAVRTHVFKCFNVEFVLLVDRL